MDPALNNSLKNAMEALHLADLEVHRPKEDAVTFCACQCTRTAAGEFLQAYLLSKLLFNSKDKSLSVLLQQCIEIDPDFKAIDLSSFDCKINKDHNAYCLQVEKVNECFKVAENISQLVLQKLNIS